MITLLIISFIVLLLSYTLPEDVKDKIYFATQDELTNTLYNLKFYTNFSEERHEKYEQAVLEYNRKTGGINAAISLEATDSSGNIIKYRGYRALYIRTYNNISMYDLLEN